MNGHTTRFPRALTTLFFAILLLLTASGSSSAQRILVVNDNDNITYNSDTIKNDLMHTTYASNIHYWSIPDSSGASPSDLYMDSFALVIWYCSTDGVGLAFWNGSATGNANIISYVQTGKPFWIIGQDALYQVHTAPATFAAGDFAKDYMGLTSYDVQSYVDDGSLGVPSVARVSSASALFPDTLRWSFSTLWYVDGCTPASSTLSIYQMAPASYSLAGRKSMFHNNTGGMSVMSTFFDPALIDSFHNRTNFMQKSIAYLLSTSPVSVTQNPVYGKINMFPNPATSSFKLNIDLYRDASIAIELFDIAGKRIVRQEMYVSAGEPATFAADITDRAPGVYFVRVIDSDDVVLFSSTLRKD